MQFHGRRLGSYLRHGWRPAIWEKAPRLGIKTLTTNTKQGRFTVNTSDQHISKALFLRGEFDYAIMDRAISLLVKHGLLQSKQQGVLLDVGANIGTVCVRTTTQRRIF